MRGARSGGVGVAVSIAVHALVMWSLPSARGMSIAGQLAEKAPQHANDAPISFSGSGTTITLELTPVESTRGAPRRNAGIDSGGNRSGGDLAAPQHSGLLDRHDPLTLEDSPHNASAQAQVQRIHTSPWRVSDENRRATPNPEDDAYVANGAGPQPIRATSHVQAPRTGQAGESRAAQPLGHAHAGSTPEGEPGARAGTLGIAHPTPGAVRGRASSDGSAAARDLPSRHARADLDPGRAATLAQMPGRTSDNRDADLRAAQLVQAFVQAGTAGATTGSGRGGQGNQGEPGAGNGARAGSRARAWAQGGDGEPTGERYSLWYAEQRERIARLLVFPRQRQLAMDQGTTLLQVWIARNGQLLEPPEVLRSSGFSDLDRAALAAVMRSAPFSPLPPDIAPDRSRLRLMVPIEFWNPTVH